MKRFIINIDYTNILALQYRQNMYLFVDKKLVKTINLNAEEELHKNECIETKKYIESISVEIEDDMDLVISFESKDFDEKMWGNDTLDLFLQNFLFALVAGYVAFNKLHYPSYFIQTLYGYATRFRLMSETDAAFDVKFYHMNKELPIIGMKCKNEPNIYMETYLREFSEEKIKKEYGMYNKSVVFASIAVFIVGIVIALISIFVFNVKRVGAMIGISTTVSSIIFLIRNLIIGIIQYRKLKSKNFNLYEFINNGKDK